MRKFQIVSLFILVLSASGVYSAFGRSVSFARYKFSITASHGISEITAENTFNKSERDPDPKSFEKKVQQVFQKVSAACVRVSKYDSTGHRRFGSFSGVIVSPEGLILTAAHATITGESYLVELPDGRKLRATALGRMPVTDAAMIQIDIVKGKLPYCQVGWSYDLRINQPCLSIAYPASLNDLKNPVLRLGAVVRSVTPEGKMQTSCLMEPGDSGGPVFDLYGRVIGLHSKIETSLTMNFENPIDNYRKYWKALKKQVDYPADAYPDPEDIGTDHRSVGIVADIPLSEVVRAVTNKQKGASVRIKSSLGRVDLSTWGSVVSLPGHPETRYVLSKSSVVGDQPVLTTSDLKTLQATVLTRDAENDLVLLKADGLEEGIVLQSGTADLMQHKEGEFLISPSYGDSLRVGVLGNALVEVKLMNRPFLGIMCIAPDSNTVQINGFAVHLSQQYGLQVDDVVDSLNGIRVTSAKKLNLYVSGLKSGDDAFFVLTRAGKKVRIHAQIQKMPKMANIHAADNFAGGMSLRSEGFKRVFVHDSMLRPEECGGPVYDLDGNFCGINIARISRTSTLAIPSSIILDFVLRALTNHGV